MKMMPLEALRHADVWQGTSADCRRSTRPSLRERPRGVHPSVTWLRNRPDCRVCLRTLCSEKSFWARWLPTIYRQPPPELAVVGDHRKAWRKGMLSDGEGGGTWVAAGLGPRDKGRGARGEAA